MDTRACSGQVTGRTCTTVAWLGVRSEGWRYIRYANGDEELYDTSQDPLEYTNLAEQEKYAEQKAQLAKWLPQENAKDLANRGGKVREELKKRLRRGKKKRQPARS